MKLMQKVYELIPAVCLFLSKEDPVHTCKDRFMQMLHLMTSGHFPLDHIHSIVFFSTFCPKCIRMYAYYSNCTLYNCVIPVHVNLSFQHLNLSYHSSHVWLSHLLFFFEPFNITCYCKLT